jgi:two-component system chemotaxis response regulator CheY
MKGKILVVDDSSTIRRIVKNILENLGYKDVIEACDGLDALAKLKQEQVALVMTDWNMPEMDGLSLVKAIRSSATLSKIPIVMVTTEAAKAEVVEALKEGVNDYVVKPFTPETVKGKIDKFLV